MEKSQQRCSFCGRDKAQTKLLIAGIDAHICDSCVVQAQTILQEEMATRSEAKFKNVDLKKPHEIKAYLLSARRKPRESFP